MTRSMTFSNSVLVQDPCYDRVTQQNLVSVVAGKWHYRFDGESLLAWSDRISRPDIEDVSRLGTRLPIEVGVDSGQISIVCNTLYPLGDTGEYGDKTTFYGQACELTVGENASGLLFDESGEARGVVSRTAYGDGCYPAYAIMRDGRAEAIVVLTGDSPWDGYDEDEDEDDYEEEDTEL